MEDWGKLCEDISKWIKKYADENGIFALVVGVSGGIDSAVTSTLCAKSGLETIAVNMPIHQESSQYDLAKRHIEWLESRWANVSSHLVDLTESYDSYVESALDGLEISELSMANTRARLRMATLYAISGSRKGMGQHQWAMARVNSATPSKSWAVVKKSKAKKKKKK